MKIELKKSLFEKQGRWALFRRLAHIVDNGRLLTNGNKSLIS